MKSTHKTQGFTLVELLIVIVVIAILAAITLVAYNGVQKRARASATKSDIANISRVLNTQFIANDSTLTVDNEDVRDDVKKQLGPISEKINWEEDGEAVTKKGEYQAHMYEWGGSSGELYLYFYNYEAKGWNKASWSWSSGESIYTEPRISDGQLTQPGSWGEPCSTDTLEQCGYIPQ